IFYDDLVRRSSQKGQRSRRKTPAKTAAATEAPKDVAKTDAGKGEEDRRQQAFDLVLDTIDALADERDPGEKIWGSMVKQALKRRNPGFDESYYGFRSFSDLLQEAQSRKLVELEADQKS